MTTARGPGRPPREGGPQSHGSLSFPKAVAVLVVAAAIGVYLLQLAGGRPSAPAAAGSTTSTTSATGSTTTTGPVTTTTTTTTSGASAPTTAVKVLVANASDRNGVAGYYTKDLSTKGWGTLTPTSALTVESSSSVYYVPGLQGAAATIALELGIPSTAVGPLTAATPVQPTSSAQVVVVIGDDLAAKAPATA